MSSIMFQLQIKGDEKIVDLEISGHSLVLTESRDCFTMTATGYWGWAPMAAEWAGGRELLCLLASGSGAGVSAWWMASISLGMSIFFLCVQYPLMHLARIIVILMIFNQRNFSDS